MMNQSLDIDQFSLILCAQVFLSEIYQFYFNHSLPHLHNNNDGFFFSMVLSNFPKRPDINRNLDHYVNKKLMP